MLGRILPVATAVALALATHAARADAGCAKCNHAKDAKHATAPADGAGAAAQVAIADVSLLDQDGKAVRFPAVVEDRIVVMDFVFTTCTTVCPVLSAIFTGVQAKLGRALDDDVRLVSISIDPARDTPARLKAYAERHRSGPGWTWLTGDAKDVRTALEAVGAYTADFQNHAPMILVGDARANRWHRFVGFPSQERIVAKVQELRAQREATSALQEETR